MAAQYNALVSDMIVRIAEATDSEQGFMYSGAKMIPVLAEDGIVEVNSEMTNEQGHPAVRISDKGREYVASLDNKEVTEMTDNTENNAISGIVANIEMPARTRKSSSRGSRYPFDDLEVGQAFFVPKSDKMPEPSKSMSSQVSNARKRYSVDTGETKMRGDKEVAVLEYERDFKVAQVEDGEAFGPEFAGVSGVGIWRVK